MVRLHTVNVGKADCFVLEFILDGETKWVVLDGGSKKTPVTLPLSYLRAHDVERIDLMILTHLHQDHLGYLADIAYDPAISIDTAVLPYPRIPLPAKRLPLVLPAPRAETVREYNHLHDALALQYTTVHTVFPFREIPLFSYGAYTLQCVYPTAPMASPVCSAYLTAADASDDAAAAMLDASREQINADSSVWLLRKGNAPLALFCGDCVSSSVDEALSHSENFTCPVVKLSHHGRNDKGRIYFTAAQIEAMRPQKLIITSDAKNDERHHAAWETLCAGADLYVTCYSGEGFVFELD